MTKDKAASNQTKYAMQHAYVTTNFKYGLGNWLMDYQERVNSAALGAILPPAKWLATHRNRDLL